jgi:fatty acid desaturase
MASAELAAPARTLKDPALKEQLQLLRQTDNLTNWYYLTRTYLFLAAVIGGAVWFHLARPGLGLSWVWELPVALAAIVLVGAGQHQLSGLAHEGSHHILFRGRYLNDLAADWFCMFPLFGSVHHYRLQHLAHHQFVNDPLRDPDVSQLQTSGHWLNFPLGKREFLRTLVKQLWVPNLVRFIRIRAQYNATGTDKNPYLRKGVTLSKVAVKIGVAYLLWSVLMFTALVVNGDSVLLAVAPAVGLLAICLVFLQLPDDKYHQSRVHPVVPLRWMTVLRMTFFTLLFAALAWTTYLTGEWAGVYFLVLWLVPLLTSFSFFMILRQLVQHGNGGRGWLTNTRVFLVSRFINFCVFPMGQDYHLPHHMFATVPHYRLRRLHQFLLSYPEYLEQAVVVEGYFLPPHRPAERPTVLDVLGPVYAPRARDVFIDNTVMEGDAFDEREAIIREGSGPPPVRAESTSE